MFTAENHSTDGVFYDYEVLNEILADLLAQGGGEARDEAGLMDEISRAITECEGVLYYGRTVVGGILDASDDA